jgi:hypothetical protein
MWNKITSIILVLSMILMPIVVSAAPPVPTGGKITGLRYGQKAPYTGVLLNSIAAANLLTDKDYSDDQWQLKLEYELAKQSAQLNLTIESQKISYNFLQEKHITLINLKNDEIERLSKIVSNKGDYSTFWAVGGILVGIGLSIAVVYAVNNVD